MFLPVKLPFGAILSFVSMLLVDGFLLFSFEVWDGLFLAELMLFLWKWSSSFSKLPFLKYVEHDSLCLSSTKFDSLW
jgi:hypothetical protein